MGGRAMRDISVGLVLLTWACSLLAQVISEPVELQPENDQQQLIELRNELEQVRGAPSNEPAAASEQEQGLDALERRIDALERAQRLDALERRIDALAESLQQAESQADPQFESGIVEQPFDEGAPEELIGVSIPDEDYGGALRLGDL